MSPPVLLTYSASTERAPHRCRAWLPVESKPSEVSVGAFRRMRARCVFVALLTWHPFMVTIDGQARASVADPSVTDVDPVVGTWELDVAASTFYRAHRRNRNCGFTSRSTRASRQQSPPHTPTAVEPFLSTSPATTMSRRRSRAQTQRRNPNAKVRRVHRRGGTLTRRTRRRSDSPCCLL